MHNEEFIGPTTSISQEIDMMKYRQKDESFNDKIKRMAKALSDNKEHQYDLEKIFGNMRFLPAGRVQAAIGSNRITRIELPLKKYNEDIGMKGIGIILFDGSKFLINNMKECVKELYQIFKDENCNIKPKIQKI